MSLKDNIARDINRVFLNTNEYADNLTLQVGTERFSIKGSLQRNIVENNSGSGTALQSVAWTLYIAYPLIKGELRAVLSVGRKITLDDNPYTIIDLSDELGLAELHLKAGAGR